MQKSYEVENVKCENCAKLIKNALKDEFGEVEVGVDEKTITLDVKEGQEDMLKVTMDSIGFAIKN